MSENSPFQDLIGRVRAGDEAAAVELVRRYEATLRRTIRVRLRDARLGRLFDSMDICQSVLGSFFVRVALGQYQLDSPEHLVRLLSTMARNKLAKQARKQQAQRRDYRRVVNHHTERQIVAPGAGPAEQVAARELLAVALGRLLPHERRLLDLRQEGRGWDEIAAVVGGRPDALRMQLGRATDRIVRELGLDETRHE